jgi:hypothetical protein
MQAHPLLQPLIAVSALCVAAAAISFIVKTAREERTLR